MEKYFMLKEYKQNFFLSLFKNIENYMFKKKSKFVSKQEINFMYDCSTAAYTLKKMVNERLKEAINILNEKKDAIKNNIIGLINLLKDNLFYFFSIANLNSG